MIGLLLLAAHMLGDYITQTDWMAKNKLMRFKTVTRFWAFDRFWFHSGVRTLHVAIYTLPFYIVAFLGGISPQNARWFVLSIFVTHWITDCRRWASGDGWPAKPILFDQTIHIATLAIIGTIFFGVK